MKKHLLAGFVLAAAAIGTAHAQSFSASGSPSQRPRTQRPVAPTPAGVPVGALPRAARGNPLQMLNPKAPAKYYGTPGETVTYDQNNPSHVTGIILFGLRF